MRFLDNGLGVQLLQRHRRHRLRAWAIAWTAADAPASVVMQGMWWRIAASRIS